MPTENQMKQAALAAITARQGAMQQPAPAQQVSGYTVQSPEEAADVATATRVSPVVGPIDFAATAVKDIPWMATTAAGEAIGGAVTKSPAGAKAGGAIAQIPYTLAARAVGGTGGKSFASELVENETAYGTGTLIGSGLQRLGSWAWNTAPVQTLARGVAKSVMGGMLPYASADLAFGRELVDDLGKAINGVRKTAGKPLYSRDALGQRVTEAYDELVQTGLLALPDVAGGSLPAMVEGLAGGSLVTRGAFGRKARAQDALLEAWPKVWAQALGKEAQSPDILATALSTQVAGALTKAEKAAGGAMGAVEAEVGETAIQLGPDDLEGLRRQLSLYAKRTKDAEGLPKVELDPEGIDRHLKNAIALVERSDPRWKWDSDAGDFVQREAALPAGFDKLAKVDPKMLATLKASGQIPAGELPQAVPLTFSDIKTLKSDIGEIGSRISEGDKRKASSTLATLQSVLAGKLDGVLRAADAAAGRDALAADSLTQRYTSASSEYGRLAEMRRAAFPAKTWLDSMRAAGNGAEILKSVWPDTADINRVGALRDLMGGADSDLWKQLQRFKAEQMVEKAQSPASILATLRSVDKSEAYWEAALGKDQYERLLRFAELGARIQGRPNPYRGEAGLTRRQESGVANALASPLQGSGFGRKIGTLAAGAVAGAGGMTLASTLGATGAATGGALALGGYVIGMRRLGKWLLDTKNGPMLLSIMEGKPITLKQRTWLKDAVGRVYADAAVDEVPDIQPIPDRASMGHLRAMSGTGVAASR